MKRMMMLPLATFLGVSSGIGCDSGSTATATNPNLADATSSDSATPGGQPGGTDTAPGNVTGNGGPLSGWVGNWVADRMDWTYHCDNGDDGGAYSQGATSLQIVTAGAGRLEIKQSDLHDPQTWACRVDNDVATVVETIDDSSDASDFGAHQRNVVEIDSTGSFTLESAERITTLWTVSYKVGGTTCSEDITGSFRHGVSGQAADGDPQDDFDPGDEQDPWECSFDGFCDQGCADDPDCD